MKRIINKIREYLRLILAKLFNINDTPHKIALGLGLGVFAGILPGTGPIAAIFLALAFRANRVSALLGSLLTNTWLSLVTFLLSIKVGSVIMGVDGQRVYDNWLLFLKNFRLADLFKLSVLEVISPAILGYMVVAAGLGLSVYLIALIALSIARRSSATRGKIRNNQP